MGLLVFRCGAGNKGHIEGAQHVIARQPGDQDKDKAAEGMSRSEVEAGADDLVFGEEARQRRYPRQRQRSHQEEEAGGGHLAPEASHLAHVLLPVHCVDDVAGGKEEQRLEERVRHQVKEARDLGADSDCEEHVADLAHGGVGQHPLDVGLGGRRQGREQRRPQADVLGRGSGTGSVRV